MIEKTFNIQRKITVTYIDPRACSLMHEVMDVPQKYECIFNDKFHYFFPEEHAIMVRRMKRTFENYIQYHYTHRKTEIIKMGIMGF